MEHRSLANDIKRCGDTTSFTDELKGTVHTSAGCGTPVGYPSGYTKAQDLIMVQTSEDGNPPPPPGQVEYIDLSLRKFITQVNGIDIATSREPNVDVGPLKTETPTSVLGSSLLGSRLGGSLESKTTVTEEKLGKPVVSGGQEAERWI